MDPMGGYGVVETGYLVFSLKSGPKGSITGAHLCLGISLGSTLKSLWGGSTFVQGVPGFLYGLGLRL